jgi:hypothetical protein
MTGLDWIRLGREYWYSDRVVLLAVSTSSVFVECASIITSSSAAISFLTFTRFPLVCRAVILRWCRLVFGIGLDWNLTGRGSNYL